MLLPGSIAENTRVSLNMLLVISVSRSDSRLIPVLEKSFALFPPGGGHQLLVAGFPNVSGEAEGLRNSLSSYFDESNSYIFDNDCHLGWPSSCNYAFQQVCHHASNRNAPWLWFELDATPIKENWLSAIEEAYREGSTRFMGCLERTYRGFNGELLSEEDGGKHMAACGVYPPDAADTIVPLKGVSETDIPWWSFLQWYIYPFCSHTNLIQNNYKTQNYRTAEVPPFTDIDCDSCNNTAWGNHYNYSFDPDTTPAVLVHGCKDGSLLDLLTPRIKCQVPTEIADKAISQLKELGNALDEPTKLFTTAQQNDKEEEKETEESEEQGGQNSGPEEKKDQSNTKPTPKSYRKRGRKPKKVLGLSPL